MGRSSGSPPVHDQTGEVHPIVLEPADGCLLGSAVAAHRLLPAVGVAEAASGTPLPRLHLERADVAAFADLQGFSAHLNLPVSYSQEARHGGFHAQECPDAEG